MKKYLIPVMMLCLGLWTTPVQAVEYFGFEAEEGDLLGWVVIDSTYTATDLAAFADTASAGAYITHTGTSRGDAPVPTSELATYSITVTEGGQYKFLVRVITPTSSSSPTVDGNEGNNDSLWFRIQNATSPTDWIRYNPDHSATAWAWGEVGDRWTLEPGDYTIEMGPRENYTLIDGFVFTNDMDLTTADLGDEIPYKTLPVLASNPVPASGTADTPRAPGVAIDALLSWTAPEGVESPEYRVRVGTIDPNDNPNSPQLQVLQTADTSVDPDLEYDTLYYWRVEVLGDVNEVTQDREVFVGETWTFETVSQGPYIAEDPVAAFADAGDDVVFTGGGTAVLGIQYQWYMESAPDDVALTESAEYSGVNTPTLTVLDIDEMDEGGYYLVMTTDPATRTVETYRAPLVIREQLAYYPLDGSGDNVLGGHDLVATGDVSYVAGIEGQAASFDGADDMLSENGTDIGADLLNGLPGLTVMAWVKSNQTSTDRGFIIFQEPAGNDDADLRYDAAGASSSGTPNLLKAGITTTQGVRQVETAENTQTTEWQHVAMTWATGQPLRVFLDGMETDPAASSATVINAVLEGFGPLIVGRGGKDTADVDTGAFNSWDGLVDEIQIFNYPLDRFAVAQIYANGSGNSVCPEFPEFDLNQNCVVDVEDLLTIITESWMECNLVPDCLP